MASAEDVRRLLDIEEIRRVTYTYAEICDDNHNPDRIGSVFTEDGVWDGGEMYGTLRGQAEIREGFKGFSAAIDFSRHNLLNNIIDVDGDTAKARWYWLGLYRKRGGPDYIQAGTYYFDYKRTDRGWLISSVRPVAKISARTSVGWEHELFQV